MGIDTPSRPPGVAAFVVFQIKGRMRNESNRARVKLKPLMRAAHLEGHRGEEAAIWVAQAAIRAAIYSLLASKGEWLEPSDLAVWGWES